MTSIAPHEDRRFVPWRLALAIAGLAGLIFWVHGRALGLGFFMDDYAHLRQLQEAGWSLADLTAACRLELVGGVVELWWLPECTLRFFRPVAFGIMKFTYTLIDWQPEPMHLASLAWHLSACTLLMLLLRRLGAAQWLAWAMAGLFAVHPAHVATVQWIACQTELMVTTFLLGAALCFGRFRGWPGFGDADALGRWQRVGWATASSMLFVMALGCRENAIMFPIVLATVEPLVWKTRRREALAWYGVAAVLIVGYLALRTAMLSGAQLPPKPYVIPPTDPDFLRFVFDKALYYLLGEYLMVPCVPIGGLPYLQARPWLFYSMAGAVVGLLVGACVRYFRRPPGLIGPAWLLGFAAPVLPVFASPHHLYLPGVGWAITMMLLVRSLGRVRQNATGWWPRTRRVSTVVAAAGLGALFIRVGTWHGLGFETGQRVEECLVAELISAPSGLHDGDVLYVANMPLLGHYCRLAVEEETGLRGLRVVPLTWSPRILGPTTPTELIRHDPQTIDIRVADDRYFAGPLRRLIVEANGEDIPNVVDRTEELGFSVVVLERDERGIQALRFKFARPLSDARLHLFWGSRTRWAYEIAWDRHDD